MERERGYDRNVLWRMDRRKGWIQLCLHVLGRFQIRRQRSRALAVTHLRSIYSSWLNPILLLKQWLHLFAEDSACMIGWVTSYLNTECVSRSESDLELYLNGTIWPRRPCTTFLLESCHPELDQSNLSTMDVNFHWKQMLIGIVQ
jgi:hypothetical protein